MRRCSGGSNTAANRIVALLAERWCYREGRVRTLAAVSDGIAGELATHFAGVPVVVTPNGVDARRFRPNKTDRSRIRSAGGAADDDVVVLFVGGDWDRKGLAVAIEAVAEGVLLGAGRLKLWVVGHGDVHRFRSVASKTV